MTLHLRTRALDAQIFGAEVERLPIIKRDGQRLAVLLQTQFGRPRLRRCTAHVELPTGKTDRDKARRPRGRSIARTAVEVDTANSQAATRAAFPLSDLLLT